MAGIPGGILGVCPVFVVDSAVVFAPAISLARFHCQSFVQHMGVDSALCSRPGGRRAAEPSACIADDHSHGMLKGHAQTRGVACQWWPPIVRACAGRLIGLLGDGQVVKWSREGSNLPRGHRVLYWFRTEGTSVCYSTTSTCWSGSSS